MATRSVSHRHILVDVGSFGYEDGDVITRHDRPTPDSIARAREVQQREREAVYLKTGWYPQDVAYTPAVIIHCPRCKFSVMRATEGQAMQVLAEHFGAKHLPAHLRRPPQGIAS